MNKSSYYSFVSDKSSRRIDLLLVDYFEEIGGVFSRTQIQGWIKSGNVTVNDKKVKPSVTIYNGDRLNILIPEPIKLDVVSENLPLTVVYEDAYIIVLNKTAGMVVHPAPGNYNKTLVNAVLFHTSGCLSTIGGNTRPGVVHRLDKDTSGLIVMAKQDAVHLDLARQFATKQARREYIAVVHGYPKENSATWSTFYGRHPGDRKKFTSKLENGKSAITHYRVLSSSSNLSLVRFKLDTGRTHQIRVHSYEHGYPLVADEVYCTKKQNDKKYMSRQALHALKLSLVHPVTKTFMSFISGLPKDIEELIQRTGLEY